MFVTSYDRARFTILCHGDEFLVDVLTLKGNGSCTCVHYLARLKPVIEQAQKDGSFVPSDRFRCPHITAARAFLLDHFIQKLMEQFPDNENEI